MPIELNRGLKDLLKILLLSFGVIAYDGNPYLIDDHRTPINPFHTKIFFNILWRAKNGTHVVCTILAYDVTSPVTTKLARLMG